MKRALLFAAAFVFAGAAAAADQVVYEPVMTGPAWQGLYVGGHVGVGMQTVMENYPDSSNPEYRQDIGGSGFLGGVFVGYNWLVAPQWVVGAEAEANYSDISGVWYGLDDPATRHEWSVAARARAGYLVNPYSLLYASLGWSYGEWESEYIELWEDGDYKAHGVQLGFGIETFATDRLSLRLESIFTAYQDKDFTFSIPTDTLRVDAETLVVRFGAAYHFGQPSADAQPVPAYNWTGFYVGAHAGAGMFGFEESYSASTYTQDIGGHGVVGGGFAGFNWQVSQMIVVGAELEANISGVDGEWYGEGVSEEWSAAARLRAGYLVNPATLLYASAGYAYGNFEIPLQFSCCGLPTESDSFDGVQLGLGIETRLSERVSVRAEGLYTFFGEETIFVPGNSGDTNFDFDTLTGRIGVAYHF